jgi:nickel-dependent lactate racemase
VVFSTGSKTASLGEADIRKVVSEGLKSFGLDGQSVLAIIPDYTRSGPAHLFFRAIADALLPKANRIDFLLALGTHPPMSEEKINEFLKLTPAERTGPYARVRILNHCFDDPSHLTHVGTVSGDRVSAISGGRMTDPVPVMLNKAIFDYDRLLICGPVFPHEVAGFSGGHKYLFPGIAAREIIDATHWLGALITNVEINGTRDTPVRALIEEAASMVPVERHAITYVVDPQALRGVFAGPVVEAWKAAAALSDQVHITYHDRPYHTVLSCAPPMYDEIWTAGKCMYKLEPVVADGGTLIIYAPHIREVSVTHGRLIREIGYHTRDFFLAQWERYRHYPWGVLAHSTHVKGAGTFDGGVEKPRIEVVLATGIPEAECRAINLGYADPATIDPEDYRGREAEGVLLVPKAGETLYRLREPPAA